MVLVLAYTVSILIEISFRFSHSSKRNTFTFLSLYISHVLMEKIVHFPFRHHSCLVKLTLLQLHHLTSLIRLTNITSLHQNFTCFLCSILTLHYSNIISHYTDSFRYSTSTFATHFYFARSKMCLIFHLQLHIEYFETTALLRRRRN